MKKMLVADDSVTIQKVIALTFAEEPVEIQSVGSGSDALEKVKEWRPDIILADVIMPQVNGYELSKAVKEDENTKDIPVLLLAGTFEAFDEEEAKAAGADDFITKPFESGELIEKVNGLLEISGKTPMPAAEETSEPSPGPDTDPDQIQAQALEQAAMPAQDTVEDVTPELPGQPSDSAPVPQPPLSADEPPAREASMGSEDLTGPGPDSVGHVPQQPPEISEAEPDIWDILSEADSVDEDQIAEPGEFPSPQPALGVLEGADVVDVGSFEVGLDRTAGPQIEDLVSMEPEGNLEGDGSEQIRPEDPVSLTEEKSKVEERERDFFGFETVGADKPAPGSMEDAIEEITFDLEADQSGVSVPEIPVDDTPFAVQEPDAPAAPQAGEPVSSEPFSIDPHMEAMKDHPSVKPEIPGARETPVSEEPLKPLFSPEAPPEISVATEEHQVQEVPGLPEDPQASPVSAGFEIPPVPEIPEIPETPRSPEISEEFLPPAEPLEFSDDLPVGEFQAEQAVSEEVEEVQFTLAEEVPEPPRDASLLEAESPFQDGVTQDPSEPDPAPVVTGPAPDYHSEVPPDKAGDISHVKDADLEAMVRAIVEEKVEKVAWEVVPELSEVLIKEAIEKIKGGT